MKKKLSALLMALVMVFTTVTAVLGDAQIFRAHELVVKLHYNRPDGDYTDWTTWFWDGTASLDAPFEEIDGEMVASYTVTAGANEVGYIVRTPDWGKDVDKDQFIDVSSYLSGTVHVYVESGVEGHAIVEDEVVVGTKVKSAYYKDGVISVEISAPPADVTGLFTIVGDEGEVAISQISGTDGTVFT